MSAQENTRVVSELFDRFFNGRDIQSVEKLVHPDYLFHNGPPGGPKGRDSFVRGMGRVWTSFPDLHFEVRHLVGDGDIVVVRSDVTATHQGDFMGIPATGRSVALGVADFYRLADGVIVEHWDVVDNFSTLARIGHGLSPEVQAMVPVWGPVSAISPDP